MKKVYLVFSRVSYGHEEHDVLEWVVAVYPEREAAEQHARLAKQSAESAGTDEDRERLYRENTLDPYVPVPGDVQRTSYYVRDVIFARHVDEFQERVEVARTAQRAQE